MRPGVLNSIVSIVIFLLPILCEGSNMLIFMAFLERIQHAASLTNKQYPLFQFVVCFVAEKLCDDFLFRYIREIEAVLSS